MKTKDRNQRINVLISETLNDQLSQAAQKSGVTKSAFIRVALEREFARDRKLDKEIAGEIRRVN
jgi:hypothetical protein